MFSQVLKRFAILDEKKNVVSVEDTAVWAEWMENPQNSLKVWFDEIGGIRITTTFTGQLNSLSAVLSLSGKKKNPLYFETWLLGEDRSGKGDRRIRQYSTWDDAKSGHSEIVKMVQSGELPARK